MSAYGHVMEREYSAQSLSCRGDSGRESQYNIQSGIYVEPFAAMLFLGGLLIVGFSLLALLITLTVMLQSCQHKNAGIIEWWKSSDDRNYCKILALHSELNGLNASSFPSFCKDVATQYIKGGQYMRDLIDTVQIINKYLNSTRPSNDGLDVVLMDADDVLAVSSSHNNVLSSELSLFGCIDCIQEAKNLKYTYLLKIYTRIQAGGWPVALLSRKSKKLCNNSIEHLVLAGFGGWRSLFMRTDTEMLMDDFEYISTQRHLMQKEGFRIIAVISSQMDALTGFFPGILLFKFPKPHLLQFRALY